jgi:hypothetical protein
LYSTNNKTTSIHKRDLQNVLWHIPRERAKKHHAIERKGEIGIKILKEIVCTREVFYSMGNYQELNEICFEFQASAHPK